MAFVQRAEKVQWIQVNSIQGKTMTDITSPKKLSTKCKLTPLSTIAFLVGIVALVLSLVGIGFGVFIWYHPNSDQFEQSLIQFQGELQRTQAQLQTAITINRKDIDQLMREITHPSSAQTVAKMAYLIQLAHFHLTTESNITAAISLLKMVKQQLQSVSSSVMIPFKQAVDQDIAVLSTVPKINTSELFERLDRLKYNISALSMQPKQSASTPLSTAVPATKKKTIWKKIKHSIAEAFNNLFIIHRMNQSAYPLTSSKETFFLKENLQLQLNQAQWAVLNCEPMIYQYSLKTAIRWLSNYDHNQPETDAMIKKIQALMVIDIKPQITSLHSLPIVRTLLTTDIEDYR